MRFCSKCGTQVADGVVFCSSCGSKIDNSESTPAGYTNPAAQPVYGYSVRSYHRPVKTDRSLAMYILLSIITCGIYGYFFVYDLAQDTNEMCEGDGENTAGLLIYIILSTLTCGLYSMYWMYKIQNRLHATGPRHGIPVAETGTTVLLWYLVGSLLCGIGSFVAMNIVITSANKVGTAYNMKYVYNNR